ncbi:MAG: hypothetical protein MUO60_10435, partial [Clostridiaceae bacterium]|nr:hypothetical protein [Clostridiaceae bacterium]
NTARPLSWTKQTADRIINGSLISKSRTSLKSSFTPNTFLISSVGINDTSIYVNDAFPYFSELDSGPTELPEFKRNINILDYTSLDTIKYEKLISVKVKGDYGSIVGINTFTSSPGIQTGRLEFKLKSNRYDNNNLGIGYSSLNTFGIKSSQLEIGDYFVISNSNVICGHALTGITDSLGGMSNYPNSKVGTARSFIDGVYKVEGVTAANAGIVTVSCNFVAVNGGISVNIAGLSQTTFYGNYSWGKFYDYDNRQLGVSTQFEVNTDNGLIGLSTSPQVSRTVPLLL